MLTHLCLVTYKDPAAVDAVTQAAIEAAYLKLPSLIPFGGGRHKCIGNAFALLQVRTIFTWLLHHYEFELAQPAEYYREVMPTLILRPSDPCRVKYRRRPV